MSALDRPLPRLRQAVLAASDLDSVSTTLRERLGLGEPFSDPAVAVFGLENRVFALGDTFLEVVTPVKEGTAAGRWLARRGTDSGYMLMFELDISAPPVGGPRTAGSGRRSRSSSRTWPRSTFTRRTCGGQSWRSACRA